MHPDIFQGLDHIISVRCLLKSKEKMPGCILFFGVTDTCNPTSHFFQVPTTKKKVLQDPNFFRVSNSPYFSKQESRSQIDGTNIKDKLFMLSKFVCKKTSAFFDKLSSFNCQTGPSYILLPYKSSNCKSLASALLINATRVFRFNYKKSCLKVWLNSMIVSTFSSSDARVWCDASGLTLICWQASTNSTTRILEIN